METPATHYVEHGGVSVAWQVFGDGPAEVLFVPGWVSNVDGRPTPWTPRRRRRSASSS